MAKLGQNTSNGSGGSRAKNTETPPKGTFIALCLGSDEEYGVTRKKFDSEEEETVDLISFYFGYKLKSGEPFVIRSRRMKLSGHEKSALFQFVANWIGERPTADFDTQTLHGRPAQITVAHEVSVSSGKTYANLKSATPLMDGLEAAVPPARLFDGIFQSADTESPDDDNVPY